MIHLLETNVSINIGTVLANEEVIEGLSERGGHPVERRPLRQWMLRITAFADALEDDLENLSWPEGTIQTQKQWIGRSSGAVVRFTVQGEGIDGCDVEVFTTRPDTLLGVTYIVVAPEHPLLAQISDPSVADYVKKCSAKSNVDRMADKEKSGVFLGCFAIHPLTGEELPLWCADYVLGEYGTGAVMAVPAHDIRDFAFAETYGLPIRQVVKPVEAEGGLSDLPFVGSGIMCNSGKYDNISSAECSNLIVNELCTLNAGKKEVMCKLHDWVFSRQRYWGEAIPVYYPVVFLDAIGEPIDNPEDGLNPKLPDSSYKICYDTPIPVDEADLPLLLPKMDDFSPRGDVQGCLARALDWRFFKKAGRWYARETNTMPQVLYTNIPCASTSTTCIKLIHLV